MQLSMQFYGGAVLVALLFFHLGAQRALGRTALRFIASDESYEESYAVEYVAGLLLYLLGVLLLKNFGLPWVVACFGPYIFTLNRESFKLYASSLYLPRNFFSWNRTPWLVAHILIGLSLFDFLGSSIMTPWKNSYGDLTYHLGMISSFVFGENFPPEQFIFAGKPLSYPFFINLWSAVLWFWEPSWYLLSIIFLYQWIIVWSLIWEFLEGEKYPALPWLILFGGGTFFALQENSGQVIDQGLGFTSFISTIWIPQRSSLLGLVVALAVLHLYFRWEDKKEDGTPLLFAGFLLGLAPLAHTHICLTIGVFLTCMLLIDLARNWRSVDGRWKQILSFFALSALSVHSLPFLLEKQSFLQFEFAYFLMGKAWPLEQGALLFLQNFLVPLGLVVFLWISSKRHAVFLSLCFVFSLSWGVRLSIWGWDHIKVFVGCYLILLFIWKRLRNGSPIVTALFIPLLLFPSFVEVATIIHKGENYTVYNRDQVKTAELLVEKVPQGSILMAAPKHNNSALLSGRSLYSGYNGWLWSHGIDHSERTKRQKNFYDAIDCKGDSELCPEYLLWDSQARTYKPWIGKRFPKEKLESVAENIYRIK